MTWDKKSIASILDDVVSTNGTGQLGQVAYTRLVYRMLQAVYQRQTMDEQYAQHTKHENGVGFNGPDSVLLSDIAKKSQPYKNLTPKQAKLVARRLRKYSGQLAAVASAKQQMAMVA